MIEKPRPRDRGFDRERREAFTFIDHEFLPSSPAQGPFFELLLNSPPDGLALIHRLVDHAIAHGTRAREAGDNAISLAYADGARFFPWTGTYFLSRNSNYYATPSKALRPGPPMKSLVGNHQTQAAMDAIARIRWPLHWQRESAKVLAAGGVV